jgi:hypothetical protein
VKRDDGLPRSDGDLPGGEGVNPSETVNVVAHPEGSNKEVAIETIRGLESRYGGWHLVIGCRRKPKKRTQGDDGSQKKLTAAHRQMILHAIPARGTVFRDQARTMLYAEPLKDRRSTGDVGRDVSAKMAYGTEA